MTELLQLPVIPLRDMVIFPGVTTPVVAGRAGTLKAVQAALDGDDARVFVVTQLENTPQVTPEELHTIGTIATLAQVQKSPGRLQVLLQGESRGIAVRYRKTDDEVVEATVRTAEELPPLDPGDAALLAMLQEVKDRSIELAEKSGFPDEVVRAVLGQTEEPGALADVVASFLEIETPEKQKILEILSVEERLRRVLLHVQRQINVAEAREDIRSQVESELGDRQREMVLREQLKAIQKELGEGDESEELESLGEKLAALDLPEAVRSEIDRDFSRLRRMSPESMEYQVNRAYLETVVELPWSERSDDHLDLKRAAAILHEDHHGLDDVKDRVLEYLAVLKLHADRAPAGSEADEEEKPSSTTDIASEEPSSVRDPEPSRAPILLFSGPPGVGKTSIAKSIARSLGREYVRMSLGGVRDEADIRGHRRTYVGALPGRIIQGMRQAGTRNPVVLLDEIDKLGASFQGDPASALLEVLDPAQNDTFVDHYLGVPFDLSEVLFIATANFIQAIPGPLLDRMEVVDFSGYTEAEKLEIARRYLLPRQLERNALEPADLQISDPALARVISSYTREAGVRQLERELGKLSRKVARRIATEASASEKGEAVHVEADDVRGFLGRPSVHPERALEGDQLGVATGMYYTPAGGDIMFVEASAMRGSGQLVLTGQLGDVMKESGRAAWSYARAHATELLIDEERFEQDIHIHVPAGAIPKDGPSAGVTMATALVSALSGIPARPDVAMTGEVTLTGRVLPIGGVKEKVLGAVRAGIREIILPRENASDLEDLPQEVRETLTVHAVDHLSEVLEVALRENLGAFLVSSF